MSRFRIYHVMTWGFTSSAMAQVCFLSLIMGSLELQAFLVNLDMPGF